PVSEVEVPEVLFGFNRLRTELFSNLRYLGRVKSEQVFKRLMAQELDMLTVVTLLPTMVVERRNCPIDTRYLTISPECCYDVLNVPEHRKYIV
ncbi:hypothetical protein AVEN_240160-1, partial [Araneus ventricosus]